MKKALCMVLFAMLILSAGAALGASYDDALPLPAHVQALRAAYDAGEYGDEVYQLFSRDDFRRNGHILTVWVKDGQATGSIVGCDFYGGNLREKFTSVYSLSAEQYQLLKDYVSQSDFDALPDYSKYSADYEEMHCYTHLTGDGLSYVQMINPDSYEEESQVYMGLLELMYKFLRRKYSEYYSISAYTEYYLQYISAYKDAYDRGEYGDEVYVIRSRPIGNSGIGPSVIVSVKDGKAVVPVGEGKRVLSDDEYARLTSYIDFYDFDSLPWFMNLGVLDGVLYEYVHISKEGCRYISMANPSMEDARFFDTSGPEYAGLVKLMYALEDAGTYEEADGPLWGESTTAPKPTISINGQETEHESRAITGTTHAKLTPALLDELGIKRVERPDLDSVVLYRGSKILILDRGYSYITEIDASCFSDPKALAAELRDENAVEKSFVNLIPIGTTVVKNRIPVRAVVEATGGEVAWNGEENRVNITIDNSETENLSSEYVNVVVSLLLEEQELQ